MKNIHYYTVIANGVFVGSEIPTLEDAKSIADSYEKEGENVTIRLVTISEEIVYPTI